MDGKKTDQVIGELVYRPQEKKFFILHSREEKYIDLSSEDKEACLEVTELEFLSEECGKVHRIRRVSDGVKV